MENRIKAKYRKKQTAWGVHIRVPDSLPVDVAANAGAEFVKFDQYHVPFDRAAIHTIVASARARGMTPVTRCRNEPHEIMSMLDAGFEGISVPNCTSADDAKRAVAATQYVPRGVRESNRPIWWRAAPEAEYFKWASTEILVQVSIEDKQGLDNYREIIKVEGLDVVATGRGDLSLALGVPNDRNHPLVIEAQKRVLFDALDAGKEIAMSFPCSPAGIEEAQFWMEKGLRLVALEPEFTLLQRVYRETFNTLAKGKPL